MKDDRTRLQVLLDRLRAANGWELLARRLPRPLVYWATIRAGVHATTGPFSDTVVPELRFVEALQRWNREDS